MESVFKLEVVPRLDEIEEEDEALPILWEEEEDLESFSFDLSLLSEFLLFDADDDSSGVRSAEEEDAVDEANGVEDSLTMDTDADDLKGSSVPPEDRENSAEGLQWKPDPTMRPVMGTIFLF